VSGEVWQAAERAGSRLLTRAIVINDVLLLTVVLTLRLSGWHRDLGHSQMKSSMICFARAVSLAPAA